MIHPKINYELVAEAIKYYENKGYEYIEVPWMVDCWAYGVTFPGKRKEFPNPPMQTEWAISSGEQGFLELINNNKIGLLGKYVCATPCFRKSDTGKSLYHFSQFFKIELINLVSGYDCTKLYEMIADALQFHLKYYSDLSIVDSADLERCECTTFINKDLVCGEIELGSYGIRRCQKSNKLTGITGMGEIYWVYGTGLALPRFEMAKDEPTKK